jgi:hypothetical protein
LAFVLGSGTWLSLIEEQVYYLRIIVEADVKAAHAKYLSYEIDPGNTTDGKLPGQENIDQDPLTH